MKRKTDNRLAFIVLCFFACIGIGYVPISLSASLQESTASDFISIDVLSPKVDGSNSIPTEATSGWPLILRLSANGELGIGSFNDSPLFPTGGIKARLVFADPDGCHSWYESCQEVDETYLDFTPGDGRSNVYDPPSSIIPQFYLYDSVTRTNSALTQVGPGSGYGPSGRLPGLVIASDAGVGLVLDDNFNLPMKAPMQARNLAGFLNSVNYELNDATGHTSIVAQMSVPGGLFTPLVLMDLSVGKKARKQCSVTDPWYRIDGGKISKTSQELLRGRLAEKIVTIRTFVVNGTAPLTLDDLDGDGIIGAKDAESAGYSLLSSEAVVRVRFLYNIFDNIFLFDLDGNGCVGEWDWGGGGPCPGGLTKVPR
jgi:hypothetical protein